MCLCQRRITGLRPDATFYVVELAARVGLLLGKLVQGVGDIAGALLLLLGKAAFFQQLAADLQNLLIQRIGTHAFRHLTRIVAQVVELIT